MEPLLNNLWGKTLATIWKNNTTWKYIYIYIYAHKGKTFSFL